MPTRTVNRAHQSLFSLYTKFNDMGSTSGNITLQFGLGRLFSFLQFKLNIRKGNFISTRRGFFQDGFRILPPSTFPDVQESAGLHDPTGTSVSWAGLNVECSWSIW